MCVHVCTHACTYRSKRSTLTVFFILHINFFESLSLRLELTISSRLVGQWAGGIFLSLLSQCQGYRHTPPHLALTWVLGIQAQILELVLSSSPQPLVGFLFVFFWWQMAQGLFPALLGHGCLLFTQFSYNSLWKHLFKFFVHLQESVFLYWS